MRDAQYAVRTGWRRTVGALTLHCFHRFLACTDPFTRATILSRFSSPRPTPAKEWIVTPPTLHEEMPVVPVTKTGGKCSARASGGEVVTVVSKGGVEFYPRLT